MSGGALGVCWGALVVLTALIFGGCGDRDARIEMNPEAEARIQLGRRIYHQGVGASGEPISARVTGDVEVLGTQFSCASCHGFSGMGSMEGSFIVPIVAGPVLYESAVQPQRPGYTVPSLAAALRAGVSPSGRSLDRLMPRFNLTDQEVDAIAAYLGTLSTGPDVGVDDEVIRLATVVPQGVSRDVREAVLTVLTTFVDEINSQTRLEGRRWDRGTTPESQLPSVYRRWELEVWELSGPAQDWDEQLQAAYDQRPVFALLGGLILGEDDPLAAFCSRNRLPCVLPSADFPASSENAPYTWYFSRGLALEADLIARHVDLAAFDAVIQVHCEAAATRAATRLGRFVNEKKPAVPVRSLTFDCDAPVPVQALSDTIAQYARPAVILWLDQSELSQLDHLGESMAAIYLSSSQMHADLEQLPSFSADQTFIAHPFKWPANQDPALTRFAAWARARNIELSFPRLQSEAFFAALVMKDGIKHMDRFLVRDYLVDLLGHMQQMGLFLPIHARPTFGPGQAYLTKGGYLLKVDAGQVVSSHPEWVIP